MSKVKLLLDVIADMKTLAGSLQVLANALAEPETTNETKAELEPKPEITLEQVRALLGKKSIAGYTTQVKELLRNYGADKLSEIDPGQYPALMADAEVLGNGKE